MDAKLNSDFFLRNLASSCLRRCSQFFFFEEVFLLLWEGAHNFFFEEVLTIFSLICPARIFHPICKCWNIFSKFGDISITDNGDPFKIIQKSNFIFLRQTSLDPSFVCGTPVPGVGMAQLSKFFISWLLITRAIKTCKQRTYHLTRQQHGNTCIGLLSIW